MRFFAAGILMPTSRLKSELSSTRKLGGRSAAALFIPMIQNSPMRSLSGISAEMSASVYESNPPGRKIGLSERWTSDLTRSQSGIALNRRSAIPGFAGLENVDRFSESDVFNSSQGFVR
jgi:hypothetical protein